MTVLPRTRKWTRTCRWPQEGQTEDSPSQHRPSRPSAWSRAACWGSAPPSTGWWTWWRWWQPPENRSCFLALISAFAHQMAWQGFFTATLCLGVIRERGYMSLAWFEPTVELNQTGIFKGRFTDWATAPWLNREFQHGHKWDSISCRRQYLSRMLGCYIFTIKFFWSHTAYQKNIFAQSNTQQSIIWDQWRHLELMEPHSKVTYMYY